MKTVLALTLFASFAHAATSYTDAQIAKIIDTVNGGEIELGRMAMKKSNDQAVDMFADRMVRDHALNREKLAKIAKQSDL